METKLQCSMSPACTNPIVRIDNKGFVYCEQHGLLRKQYIPCRKLKPKELNKLLLGEKIVY